MFVLLRRSTDDCVRQPAFTPFPETLSKGVAQDAATFFGNVAYWTGIISDIMWVISGLAATVGVAAAFALNFELTALMARIVALTIQLAVTFGNISRQASYISSAFANEKDFSVGGIQAVYGQIGGYTLGAMLENASFGPLAFIFGGVGVDKLGGIGNLGQISNFGTKVTNLLDKVFKASIITSIGGIIATGGLGVIADVYIQNEMSAYN